MGAMFGDLRYSVRSLAKDRAFTLVAVLTLTVCLGANVALFVVVHSILLRPLPVPEADRIVLMSNQYPNSAPERSHTSMVADYVDRLEQTTVFEAQAIFTTLPRTLELDSAPDRVQVLATTASLFRLLRATPAIGPKTSASSAAVVSAWISRQASWRTAWTVARILTMSSRSRSTVSAKRASAARPSPGTALTRRSSSRLRESSSSS